MYFKLSVFFLYMRSFYFKLSRYILWILRGPIFEWVALEISLTMNLYIFCLYIIVSYSCFWTVRSQLFFNNTFARSLISSNPSSYQAASTPGRFNITLSRTLSYATSQASFSDSISGLPGGPSQYLSTTTSITGSSDSLTTTILSTHYITVTRTVFLTSNTLYPIT